MFCIEHSITRRKQRLRVGARACRRADSSCRSSTCEKGDPEYWLISHAIFATNSRQQPQTLAFHACGLAVLLHAGALVGTQA